MKKVKDSVTRKPSYAVKENDVNGRKEYTVYCNVQIDGVEYKSESRSLDNYEGALEKAKENLAIKIENNYENEVRSSDID